VKYRFIEEHRSQWPVRLMCQLLQVSPGGYYTRRDRPVSARQQRREVLTMKIEAIHQEFKQGYGGDCWDNAAMESFFATLKKELVHHED
jgi:putative transposase